MTRRIRTGADVTAARASLGDLWDLGRPLHRSELGRILRLTARDPGSAIAVWEAERNLGATFDVASVVIEMLLDGAMPPPDSEWRRGAGA